MACGVVRPGHSIRIVHTLDLRKVALLVLLAGTGCGDDDSKPDDSQPQQPAPTHDAGSGGQTSTANTGTDAGSFPKDSTGTVMGTGGSMSGTGGSTGGTGGAGGSPAKPSFGAHLDGSDVILETTGQAWFEAACGHPLGVDKRVGGDWKPLRDDRPQPSNGHVDDYFLDGDYIAALDFTCDVPQCTGIGAMLRAGRALEFVKTGTKPRPNDVGLPAATLVVIETRAYSGEIAVSVTYAESARCNAEDTAIVPVTTANADDAGT
jgi:hypothetical protein